MLKWFLGIVVLIMVIGALSSSNDSSKDGPSAIVTQKTQAPPSAAETETAPTQQRVRQDPDPDGDSELQCAYELGDFGESGDPKKGYRFVAGGTLHNTGNIGIRVRVTYQWKLLGRAALTVHKHYRVRRGEDRDVNLTVPVTDADIDAHQNAAADCSAKSTIVSTFGQPPLED